MSLGHIHQDQTWLQRVKREQLLAVLGKFAVSNDIFVSLKLSLSLRSKIPCCFDQSLRAHTVQQQCWLAANSQHLF